MRFPVWVGADVLGVSRVVSTGSLPEALRLAGVGWLVRQADWLWWACLGQRPGGSVVVQAEGDEPA